MTLDEAIEHCHEKAAELDVKAMCIEEAYQTTEQAECEKCATDHRQLAEWLTELKEYREDDWKKAENELPKDWYVVLVYREIGIMEKAACVKGKWLSDEHFRELKDVKYWKTIRIPKEERRHKRGGHDI